MSLINKHYAFQYNEEKNFCIIFCMKTYKQAFIYFFEKDVKNILDYKTICKNCNKNMYKGDVKILDQIHILGGLFMGIKYLNSTYGN